MREITWDEVFAPRRDVAAIEPEVPEEPAGWRRLLWWEDWVTFGVLAVAMIAVVAAVDRARWVDDMPSLYPVGVAGLLGGYLLSRLRWPEGLVHLVALLIGATVSFASVLSAVPGATPRARYEALHERMADWFYVAFHGGASDETLAFIVLVVPVTWLSAYLAAWAVFRWHNAWLALVPAGATLLVHISLLRGQSSLAFLIFLVAAVVLVTRLNLLERARAWRRERTPYPEMLSLSALHSAFWAALLLLGLAWLLPQWDETRPLEAAWSGATEPAVERAEEFGRLFLGVNHRPGSGRVHDFEDILPFLGAIELPEGIAAQVRASPGEEPLFLRAQAYYIYTPAGWETGDTSTRRLQRNQDARPSEDLLWRRNVTLQVISRGGDSDTVLTLGQPVSVDRESEAEYSGLPGNVNRIDAGGRIEEGERYESIGSVSIATEDELRAAGESYPGWILRQYLQLGELPASVSNLAREIAAGESNPYDQAAALESYLRAIPYDLDVPKTPRGEDPIEYFLFESRRGYFDYHASAMVMMLRSLGIPSRLAVGYVLLDEERSDRGAFTLSEASAYAWPEVYFPDYGWVEFNPTPNTPRPRELAGGDSAGSSDPDPLADFAIVPQPLTGEVEPPAPSETAPLAEPEASSRAPWALTGVAAGLALLLASTAGALRYAWVRGLGGLDTPARLWGKTVRLASWAGLGPAPSQTPAEFAGALEREVPRASGARELSDAYVRHRFGGRAADEHERQRLEDAWRSVRRALLRRLLPFGKRSSG